MELLLDFPVYFIIGAVHGFSLFQFTFPIARGFPMYPYCSFMILIILNMKETPVLSWLEDVGFEIDEFMRDAVKWSMFLFLLMRWLKWICRNVCVESEALSKPDLSGSFEFQR